MSKQKTTTEDKNTYAGISVGGLLGGRAETGAFSYGETGRIAGRIRDKRTLGMGLAAMIADKQDDNNLK